MTGMEHGGMEEKEKWKNRGCSLSTKLLNNRNNSLAEEKTGLRILI